ncbi:oxygenase MpaB family protein [Allosalinactinospora lopnorensis]|uniref:oxygenase MpaB family protein n=1 Tax=Allosalinactinospora lopnorensis TaxID=1352348 RepID=UPI000623DB78|nr:oxygenase MpaB family protein [Allosalinactinospora lopnorensis]
MESGLFAEDSQIRRLNREGVLLGGAGYAILLQVAHPAVGRGVYEHSDFTARPINRLRGTLTFVYGLVFGTEEEAERVSRIVRAMHKTVVGPGYNALDPDLQIWVAATLYSSGIRMYEMTFGELDAAAKDEVYRQSAVFATALGCPEDRWPTTRADFELYWARMVDSIEVGDTAREIAAGLFAPANPLVRPLARMQRFLSAGLLPPRIRDQLGLDWGPGRQRMFDRLFAVVRAVYPRLPMAVRSLPKNAYMWDMRRQAARGRLYRRPKAAVRALPTISRRRNGAPVRSAPGRPRGHRVR